MTSSESFFFFALLLTLVNIIILACSIKLYSEIVKTSKLTKIAGEKSFPPLDF